MRRRLWVAVTLVVALFLPARVAVAHDEFRFVGTVVKWDSAKRKLEMKAKETQEDGRVTEVRVLMSVPLDVEVTRQLKKAPLSDLKPGVFVVVDAAGVGKEIDATTIEIVVLPKSAPAKTAKP